MNEWWFRSQLCSVSLYQVGTTLSNEMKFCMNPPVVGSTAQSVKSAVQLATAALFASEPIDNMHLQISSKHISWEVSVVQWQRAGLLANWSSDRSCAWGMIHNKIHLIRSGCLRTSIALTVHNRGLKHHSFIHSFKHISSALRQIDLTVYTNDW